MRFYRVILRKIWSLRLIGHREMDVLFQNRILRYPLWFLIHIETIPKKLWGECKVLFRRHPIFQIRRCLKISAMITNQRFQWFWFSNIPWILSFNYNFKVGEWLENSNLAVEKRQKAKRQSSNVSRGNYSYQTNGRSHSQSLRNPASHPNPSTLSLDSGLSSTRIDDHFGVEDAHELKGIKERLIQETEGTVETKLLYHFNDEKFVIR